MAKGVYDRLSNPVWIEGHKRGSLKLVGRSDSEETRRKKSLARLGSLNPMFGQKRTDEEKQLMSLHRKGLTANERNPNWRGGISTVAHLIRTSPEYKKWRQTILERDNYTCQNCNKRGGDLNVDHFPKTFKEILDEFSIKSIEDAIACEALWDTESNRTLCVTCHRGGGLYGEIA
jgi:5-methylcytosine-specific restriction endonuclease McrA